MKTYIKAVEVVSAAGQGLQTNWQALVAGKTYFTMHGGIPMAVLSSPLEEQIQQLQADDKNLQRADRVVALSALALTKIKPFIHDEHLVLIAGSARGASATLAAEHQRFFATGKTSVRASPLTSFGTFAALLSQHLGSNGLSLSVSATCATGIHALGASQLYLQTGVADEALCVCSEAKLSACVLQMLKSAKVLAEDVCLPYPLMPMHARRQGLVAGEGAVSLLLSRKKTPAGIYLAGYGYATEQVSLTGVSKEGKGLTQAIQRALKMANIQASDVQLVIGHGAGTQLGDRAEWHCYEKIFAGHLPPIRFHKWCIGHLLGASSLYSVALAYQQMRADACFSLPYLAAEKTHPALSATPKTIERVLVCALGFGGNCAALLLAKE